MAAEIPVLAIDGLSGTGKGSLGAWIARRLGWHFLDSGALYRVVALLAGEQGISADDEDGVARLAGTLALHFEPAADGGSVKVVVSGRDLTDAIRTEECGGAASRVAKLPAVRRALLDLQHGFRRAPGLVADGRDMGTVVFPDAALKIFLSASAEERARRRYKQLKLKGINVSLPRLSGDIAERDAQDASRAVSPTRPANDAVVIDTTQLDETQVRERVLALITGQSVLR
jgi:cytidylate kinase